MRIWDVNDFEGDRFLINLDNIAYVCEDTDNNWYTDICMNDGNVITLDIPIDELLDRIHMVVLE